MLLVWIFAAPLFLQISLMIFDEIIFHQKRGLPLWERIGHPLDTLTFIACLFVPIFQSYSHIMFYVYVALAIFSCLMVTKDEWIHKHYSSATENWVHAMLFILHPILLGGIGYLWWSFHQETLPEWLVNQNILYKDMHVFLVIQFCLTSLFFFYQAIYWNYIWIKKQRRKGLSTTPSMTH